MSTASDPKKLLRVGEAAELLGVSPHTIRKACTDGRLNYWIFPGSWDRLFDRADVVALRESMFRPATKLAAQRARAAHARAVKATMREPRQ